MKLPILRLIIFAIILTSCSPAENTATTASSVPSQTQLLPSQDPFLTQSPITTIAPTLALMPPTRTLYPTIIYPTLTPTLTPIPIGIFEIVNLSKGSASVIAWAPDGKSYAVGGTFGVYIFDANSREEIKYFPLEIQQVYELEYSPDGQYIGVIGFSEFVIIRLSDGTSQSFYRAGYDRNQEMAFSPDASLFAYTQGCPDMVPGCYEIVHLYDLLDTRMNRNLDFGSINEYVILREIAFNSDGTLLAAGSDNGILYVWVVSTGNLQVTLRGHTDEIVELGFNPANSNLLVSYSKDDTVQVWDVRTGNTVKILSGFKGDVKKISFSPDGSVLEIFTETMLKAYNTTTWEVLSHETYIDTDAVLLQEMRSTGGYIGYVAGTAFSPDGQILAVSSFSPLGFAPVVLWDVPSKQIVANIKADGAYSLIYNHQGNLLATANRDGVSIWDTGDYSQQRTMWIESVDSIAFSPNDLNVAISSEGKIYIWDIQQDNIIRIIDTGNHRVVLLSYSSGGDVISAVDAIDFYVKSWDLSTGELLRTYTPPPDPNYTEVLNLSNDTLAIFRSIYHKNNSVELLNVV